MNKKLIKKVAKVIGKKLAIHELSIVYADNGILPHSKTTVMSAFTWSETPQGGHFWNAIDCGIWPYNYERKS